jgi:Tol biopolymer transport system component
MASSRSVRNRNGAWAFYTKAGTGAGREKLLAVPPPINAVTDWSTDGRSLLYRSPNPTTGTDLWALPLDETEKPFPVVREKFSQRNGQFSPDGKWIAYESDESGQFEIYVQPFSGAEGKVEGKWQISTEGGAQVRWRRDGNELFYIALDGRLMAAPIHVAANGQSVEHETPAPLFFTNVGGAVLSIGMQEYVVSPDGKRFLMNSLIEDAGPSSLTVILNWRAKP